MHCIANKRSLLRVLAGTLFAALFAFTQAAQANLTIEKKGEIVGTVVTFTITVKNDAPTGPEGIPVVLDPLPGIGVVSWNPVPTVSDGLWFCTIGPGDEVTGSDWNYPTPPLNFPHAQDVMVCDGATVTDPVEIVVTGELQSNSSCIGLINTAYLGADDPPDAVVDATGSATSGGCGRMTGGGSIFKEVLGAKKDTIRITHGFELRCDAGDPRQNLEINWPGPKNGSKNQNNFHLTNLTSAHCIDDENIAPQPPNAGFDTFIGEGDGLCNGLAAHIEFVFTDAGEPGSLDTADYVISGACDLTASGNINKGNQQAHAN